MVAEETRSFVARNLGIAARLTSMAIGPIVVLLLLWVLSFVGQPVDKVVYLDVGQGDSVLYQSGQRQVLIDGGQGNSVLSRLAREMPWSDRVIDVMILTHPQRDHQEGLVYALQHYKVGLILMPQVAYGSSLEQTWLEEIRRQKIPYRFAWAGQHINLGRMNVDVLSPMPTEEWQSASNKEVNDASVVTRITLDGQSFFGSGDGEGPLESQLTKNVSSHYLDSDVYKVGHHGSKGSSSLDFLKAITPKIAVISVGATNSYGHPSPETLQKLKDLNIETYRTDQDGSVRLIYKDNSWQVECTGKALLWMPNSCIKRR